jgi:transmembrane sensor
MRLPLKGTTPVPSPLGIEASEWLLIILDRHPAPGDPHFDRATVSAAFNEWVTQSDEHKAAFLRVCDTYHKMGNLDSHHRIRIEALVTEYHNTKRRSFKWAAAAALLATVSLLISPWSPVSWRPSDAQPTQYRAAVGGRRTIELAAGSKITINPNSHTPGNPTLTGSVITKLGEYRCEKLPDESQVCLNTNSAIRYIFNRSTRNIELVSGEASFVVRKDTSRPFNVLGGGALIRDLSTSFDVYRRRNSTKVTVIQGRIRIIAPINSESRVRFDLAEADSAWKAAPEFHRLQQMEFDNATGSLHLLPALTEERLSQLLAWREGRIDLNARTLAEALEEFSRYQPIAKFIYSDKSISKIRVGGSMEFTNLDGFLAALENTFHIYHTTTGTDGNTVIILSRQRNKMSDIHPRQK